MRKIYTIIGCFFLLPFFAGAQITSGQLDEFTDGTDGWLRGNAIDGKLVLTADGVGSGGKLVTFNQSSWSGDYLSENVTHIRMHISNASSEHLFMRVALGNGTNANSGTWYASTNAIEVLAGAIDQVLEFSIAEAELSLVAGSSDYNTVFDHIATLRILHSTAPSAQGNAIVAEISLDNIEAISQTDNIQSSDYDQFKLFPNPAIDELSIEVNTDGLVEVYDLTGKQIKRFPVYTGRNKINLSNWFQGIYILRISDKNETISKRLIVE
ncbi:MAG: T9SS type A sorting domain-containing protein [Bacteroidota bacterium]|nr:T9SS type A sorting domain-containing protein [Bacteroidota bacterium]